MSLYSLATDLFVDMDKARAAILLADKTKNQQHRGAAEGGGRAEFRRSNTGGKGDLLPHLASGRSDETSEPPTLELLEECLHDVQNGRARVRRRREPLEPAAGEDSPPSSPSPSLSSSGMIPSAPGSSREHATTCERSSTVDEVAEAGSGIRTVMPVTAHSATSIAPKETAENRAPMSSIFGSSSPFASSSGGVGKSAEKTEVGSSNGANEARASCSSKLNKAAANRHGTDSDSTATASYADFEREIENWRLSGGRDIASPRARMNFAAHLSAKYLCDILDPMPSSPLVCRLRREIVRRVDSLASGVEEGTSADGTDGEGEVGKERASSELNHERVAEGGGLGTIKSGTINLTRWERRTERVKPSLIQDEVGTNAVPRRNGTVAADSKKIGGLEIQKRASAKPDDRSLVQRRPAVVQFPPVQVQAADVGQGFTNRSPRSSESQPRARAVRFLLDLKNGEESRESADNDQHRPREDAVDRQSQTTQSKAETPASKTVAPQNVEAGSEELKDTGFWTCVVCCQRNDIAGARESCTTCGRRRRWRSSARANTRVISSLTQFKAPSDRPQEKEGAGSNKNASHSFTGYRATSDGSRKPVNDACSAIKRVTEQSTRGPYDLSSFAKMQEVTQPVVKARLGLTREIQSLLSAIRR